MEEVKKFPLGHTTLYCKGWYEVSDNPFDDIRKTLTADGYSGEYFSDKDIIHLLLGKMDDYFSTFKKNYNPIGFNDMYDYLLRFDWLYYEDADKSTEFKIWRFIRSRIFDLSKDDFINVEPDYNVLPKRRWYKKEWLDGRLYPLFDNWGFEYDCTTSEDFKKISEECLNKALDELLEKYDDVLEEYDNKRENIINLFKDEYTEKFLRTHFRLFDDLMEKYTKEGRL